MVSSTYLRQAIGPQATNLNCDTNPRLTLPRLPIKQPQQVGRLDAFSTWLRVRASYHYIASEARTKRPGLYRVQIAAYFNTGTITTEM
jgi:hypothetical protein